jgi:hypothetical protein
MRGITWEGVRQKRERLPDAIEAFDRDAQVARVTALVSEILEDAPAWGRA